MICICEFNCEHFLDFIFFPLAIFFLLIVSMATHSKTNKRAPSTVIETLGAKISETKDGLRKINNYLLKREIGHGAFGTVHLGINILTNKEYVCMYVIQMSIAISNISVL